MEMKKCAKCRENKPVEDFRLGGVSSNGKRYRASRCKPCHAADNRAYREANLEACRARERAYSRANAEQKRENALRWYYEKPENKAKAIDRAKDAYAADPEHKRDQAHQTRARRAKAPVVEFVRRREVYERDGGICHECGLPVEWHDYEMDHVVALAEGGDHSYANVKVSHIACNRSRAQATQRRLRANADV